MRSAHTTDIRRFEHLGRFKNEWLNANYHFSFSGYHDPRRMGGRRISRLE
tara:strand:- start:139 stop:288 length:150 start_codon:yes stop_codon:yes gene_type:complete